MINSFKLYRARAFFSSIFGLGHLMIFLLIFSSVTAFSQDKVLYIVEKYPDHQSSSRILISHLIDAQPTINSIQQSHINNGYYRCKLDTIIESKDSSTAIITVGQQYKFHQPDIQQLDENLKAFLKKKRFQDVNIDSYADINASLFELIIDYYSERGYPFAKVWLDSISLDLNNIDSKLQIDKGRNVIIDSIRINGYQDINPKVLNQYLGLSPGMIYQQNILNRIPQKIKALNFIELAKPVFFINKDGYIILQIELLKKRANQFDGIIGFRPSASDQSKISFNGSVKLELNNALQQAEQFKMQWQRLDIGSQTALIQYQMPYLFILPFGTHIGFKFNRRDSSYTNIDQDYGLLFDLGGRQKLKGSYRIAASQILSSLEDAIQNKLIDTKSRLYGLSYQIFTLDDLFNPRKGLDLQFEVFGGNSQIIKNGLFPENFYDSLQLRSSQFQLETKMQIFIPFGKRNTILLKQSGGLIKKANIYANELYRLGGFNSIRGFDEDVIQASNYQVGTVEYRWLPDAESYFSVFSDVAYINKYSQASFEPQLLWSLGTGLGLNTKAGIFSLQFAIGKSTQQAFQFNQTKVHFGYINRF